MRTKEEMELGQNIRQGLNGILELWASADQQLEYQRNVPTANVSAELFCQWFDDYYNKDNPIMIKEFSQQELEAYNEFNKIISDISDQTPGTMPSIEKFINTSEWNAVNNAAITALKKIGARYI
jgi:hypothetical protein